jgi:hypothetical protein
MINDECNCLKQDRAPRSPVHNRPRDIVHDRPISAARPSSSLSPRERAGVRGKVAQKFRGDRKFRDGYRQAAAQSSNKGSVLTIYTFHLCFRSRWAASKKVSVDGCGIVSLCLFAACHSFFALPEKSCPSVKRKTLTSSPSNVGVSV